MATPYDLYVRFLVTKGLDDPEDVNAALAEFYLPRIDAATFDAQASLVESQAPLGIQKQIATKNYSVDFLPWMKILQVDGLWHFEKLAFLPKDDPVRPLAKLAYDIHQDGQLRITVNALLIKGVPHQDIAASVNIRYATLLREGHIALYERFFFAPKTMTRGSWRTYLRACQAAETAIYFTALTAPLDELKTELELPAKHSTSEVLQYLLTKSAVKAKRLLDDDTPAGRHEARAWIDTVLKLTDKYEKHRTGDQADFANTLQMEFDFVNTEFTTPDPEVLKELADKAKAAADAQKARSPEATVPVGDDPLPEPGDTP